MKLLLAAAAFLAAGPALAQQAAPPSFAQMVAEGMKPELPKPLNDGLVMTEVGAEGGMLVVLVEDRQNLAASTTPEEMARQMAIGLAMGFCKDKAVAQQMLKIGLSIRADLLLVDGRRIESDVLDRCPD